VAETVVASGQPIYPSNRGTNGTARASDHEKYSRKRVKGANFVAEGLTLTTSISSLQVTLNAGVAFIDGRQVLDGSSNYTFTLPPSAISYIMVKRDGSVVWRDTNNPTADQDLLLFTVTTDASGVPVGQAVDNRRLAPFAEIGVADNERVYLSSDRAKYLYYDSVTGRIRIVGIIQADRILGLSDPLQDDEVATRGFVINQAVKKAKVAALGNLTLSGTQTIDNVAVVAGDIVLAPFQTTGGENGLYVVAAGAWTRHSSLDSAAEAIAGFTVYVEQGDQYAKTTWTLTTTGTVVLGTTALTFEQRRNPIIQKTANFTAAPNAVYLCDHATPATRQDVTLPASASVGIGDEVELHFRTNTGLARVIANTGQTIAFLGAVSSTAGYWQTVSVRTIVRLRYIAANTWVIVRSTGQLDSDTGTRQHMGDGTAALPVGNGTATGHAVNLGQIGGQALVREWLIGNPGTRSKTLTGSTANTGPIAFGRAGNVVVIAYVEGTTIQIAVSSDGGYTFSAVTSPGSITSGGSSGQISVFVQDASNFAVAYNNGTTLVFAATTNGGTAWTTNASTATTSLNSAACSAVCLSLTSAFWVYTVSTTSVGYALTTNAGSAYTKGTVATETVSGTAYPGIATTDGTTVYAFWAAATNKLRWSKTTNAGTAWAAAADLATDAAASTNIVAWAISATIVVVDYNTSAATANHKVLRTSNGSTFSAVLDYAGKLGHVSAANNVAALGYDGSTLHHIYQAAGISSGTNTTYNIHHAYSTDQGATWNVRTTVFGAIGIGNASGAPDPFTYGSGYLLATADYVLLGRRLGVGLPSILEVPRRAI